MLIEVPDHIVDKLAEVELDTDYPLFWRIHYRSDQPCPDEHADDVVLYDEEWTPVSKGFENCIEYLKSNCSKITSEIEEELLECLEYDGVPDKLLRKEIHRSTGYSLMPTMAITEPYGRAFLTREDAKNFLERYKYQYEGLERSLPYANRDYDTGRSMFPLGELIKIIKEAKDAQ